MHAPSIPRAIRHRAAALSIARASRIMRSTATKLHAAAAHRGDAAMAKRERLIDELYAEDAERADADSVRPAHGCLAPRLPRRRGPGRHERRGRRHHRASRPYAGRADTGRVRPGSQEGHACRRAAAAGRPAEAQLPRQGLRPRRAGRQAAGGGNARAPARRRHHADLQVLHPQQRHCFPIRPKTRTAGSSPSTARSTSRSRSRSAT